MCLGPTLVLTQFKVCRHVESYPYGASASVDSAELWVSIALPRSTVPHSFMPSAAKILIHRFLFCSLWAGGCAHAGGYAER